MNLVGRNSVSSTPRRQGELLSPVPLTGLAHSRHPQMISVENQGVGGRCGKGKTEGVGGMKRGFSSPP